MEITELTQKYYEDIAKQYFADFFLNEDKSQIYMDSRMTILNMIKQMSKEYSLVAVEDEEYIGHIIAYAIPSSTNLIGDLCIKAIEVKVGQRNKGVGTLLLNSCLGKARIGKIDTVYLDVLVEDKNLQRWYKKIGFRPSKYLSFELSISNQ